MKNPCRRLVAVLASAGFVMTGCSQHERATPEDAVIGLYRSLGLNQVRGAPSPEQLASIAPYVSAELQSRLRAARGLHDREQARSPSEKPSYADGDLFTSLFEGPTAFGIVSDTVHNDTHHVVVRFTYDKASPPVTWTDIAVVKSESGRWVVADVIYGGQWDFASKGTLLHALQPAGSGGP
jgi:hypothetical protein